MVKVDMSSRHVEIKYHSKYVRNLNRIILFLQILTNIVDKFYDLARKILKSAIFLNTKMLKYELLGFHVPTWL